ADTPDPVLPATLALGSLTFTLTALPGTPALQNALPIPYYGTNVFAAPGLGLIAAAIMFLGGLWWLRSRAARAHATGEGYGDHPDDKATDDTPDARDSALTEMPLFLAVLPL